MTIRIEPHFRVHILPNVGAAEKEGGMLLFAEIENTSEEVISSANVVAVAYTTDGTLCGVEESNTYLTLHEGERKALKLRLDVEPALVEAIRLYAETEYDEEDPYESDAALADPPTFMKDYFRHRAEIPPKDG